MARVVLSRSIVFDSTYMHTDNKFLELSAVHAVYLNAQQDTHVFSFKNVFIPIGQNNNNVFQAGERRGHNRGSVITFWYSSARIIAFTYQLI